jgi:hypothetical protein
VKPFGLAALLWIACGSPPPPAAVSNSAPFEPSKPQACQADCAHVPLRARIIKIEVTSGGTLVTFTAGSDAGVTRHAIVRLAKHPDADVVLIRVDRRTSVARSALGLNEIGTTAEITPVP